MSRSGADLIQGGARSTRTSVHCGNGMNVAFLQRLARAPWPLCQSLLHQQQPTLLLMEQAAISCGPTMLGFQSGRIDLRRLGFP
jgi:hypothetical protein